jgi:maltooligosyltrehalose trehalohydrolase
MRKYPFGAEVIGKCVHFRVWAPKSSYVELVFENGTSFPLKLEEENFYTTVLEGLPAQSRYWYRLDKEDNLYPDPASRYQPSGPIGPSQIIDPQAYVWKDHNWKGLIDQDKAIIYEMHIGTFTPEGTWRSAIKKLRHLAELGITVIEMMPVAEFCGRFNWGYDGVNLFAPTHRYGKPDDLRAFIDQAHILDIAVILDVVYNHFGPEGNFLGQFSDDFLQEHETEWGKAVNFDGPQSKQVREFFLANAGYWIDEFHFDGLRLDACHAIRDNSSSHIIAEIQKKVQQKAESKKTFVIAENEQQQFRLVEPPSVGGYGLNAVWNEDFHHTAFVRLTGRKEAYYLDYLGNSQEFVSSVKHGFLYQGQWYHWQNRKRGSCSRGERRSSLVNFLENHDQVSNSGGSRRLCQLSQPGCYRALSVLLLLSPQIPLIFQGQEFGADTPFYYFSEQNHELAEKIFKGRKEFISQFASFKSIDVLNEIPPPHDERTWIASKLNWERMCTCHYCLYKDLIALRKNDPIFSKLDHVEIDGAVLNKDAFCLRYKDENEERLLLFNLGRDLEMNPLPEPLMAPPKNCRWDILFSSERTIYGGFGNLPVTENGNWILSGSSALILQSRSEKNGLP